MYNLYVEVYKNAIRIKIVNRNDSPFNKITKYYAQGQLNSI